MHTCQRPKMPYDWACSFCSKQNQSARVGMYTCKRLKVSSDWARSYYSCIVLSSNYMYYSLNIVCPGKKTKTRKLSDTWPARGFTTSKLSEGHGTSYGIVRMYSYIQTRPTQNMGQTRPGEYYISVLLTVPPNSSLMRELVQHMMGSCPKENCKCLGRMQPAC